MKPPFLSAFDLDHTLLKVNSSFFFGMFLYKKGKISTFSIIPILFQYFLFKLHLSSPKKLNEQACKAFFHGRSLAEIEMEVAEFVSNEFNRIVNPALVQKLNESVEMGHYITILSSSPQFLVQPIAAQLGVKDWESTVYKIDDKGFVCGIERHVEGEDKAIYLKGLITLLNLEKNQIIAYSDSFFDLPFLETAGTPIAVNPDRKLRQFCLLNNWKIL